jgi:hypothetical protein
MRIAEQAMQEHDACTVFTVRLRGEVHRCALSQEALYLLSQTLDPRLDRIDAYIALKRRIARAAQGCVEDGAALPLVLEARHVIAYA